MMARMMPLYSHGIHLPIQTARGKSKYGRIVVVTGFPVMKEFLHFFTSCSRESLKDKTPRYLRTPTEPEPHSFPFGKAAEGVGDRSIQTLTSQILTTSTLLLSLCLNHLFILCWKNTLLQGEKKGYKKYSFVYSYT